MKGIRYIVKVISAVIINAIFTGLTLSILWGWFVVDTFGSIALNVPQAVGVALVVSYLTHQQTEVDRGLIQSIVLRVSISLFMLLAGWVTTLFL